MAKPELIIFDCDGVLIDSEILSFQAMTQTLGRYHIELTHAEAMSRYLGKSSVFEKADLETRHNIKFPPDYEQMKQSDLRALYEAKLTCIPGIFGLIEKAQFKKCVASSSSLARLEHSLKLVGLWDHFAPHIFSSEQVKNGKPAPDLFLFVAEQMKTHPSACLVIEDSIAGVRAAKAANMRVLGFTGGSHCGAGHGDLLLKEGAERIFNHMDQIAEVLL